MGFYRERILPHLTHLAMRQENFSAYRRRVVSGASGRVLEIGIGSGLNLPHYGPGAERVVGIDPSQRLLSMSKRSAAGTRRSITLIEGSAEDIPLEDASVDTVLTTWTLCTIPEVETALREMLRVLKPSGGLLFVEHGRSSDENVRRWQDRLTPLWRRISGGCHLNRPIRELIEDAGFRIEQLETGYMKGLRPLTFICEGKARPS
jgi:ubiquinone/menaquinone biosynthesis C-methylase UbiE